MLTHSYKHIELSQWKERTCKQTATFVQKCELLFSKRLSEKKNVGAKAYLCFASQQNIGDAFAQLVIKLGQAPVTVAMETETREQKLSLKVRNSKSANL